MNITKLNNTQRFVDISTRPVQSDIAPEIWSCLARNSCNLSWRGAALQKDAFQVVTTQALIQELQPKTIIEFGSFQGGSAAWLTDIQSLFVQNGNLISVDINLERVAPQILSDKRITFLQGDANNVRDIFSTAIINEIEHPLLMIEDAHANLVGILDYFHEHIFKIGDYCIVEDTSVSYNQAQFAVWQSKRRKNAEAKFEKFSSKINALSQWLGQKEGAYLVDTKYLDPFGILNASKNWNSVIKRVS